MYGIFLSTGDGWTFWCDHILVQNDEGEYLIFDDEYEALEYLEKNNLKDTENDQYTIEELKPLKDMS